MIDWGLVILLILLGIGILCLVSSIYECILEWKHKDEWLGDILGKNINLKG